MNKAGMNDETEKEARRLYNTCPTVKPEWEHLGDVTKSHWIGIAAQSLELEKELEKESQNVN